MVLCVCVCVQGPHPVLGTCHFIAALLAVIILLSTILRRVARCTTENYSVGRRTAIFVCPFSSVINSTSPTQRAGPSTLEPWDVDLVLAIVLRVSSSSATVSLPLGGRTAPTYLLFSVPPLYGIRQVSNHPCKHGPRERGCTIFKKQDRVLVGAR